MKNFKSGKCAVISCLGLGDGLLALVLSNNLALNGKLVDTFHPFLNQLQHFFPRLPIDPFPHDAIDAFIEGYENFFFIYDQKMQNVIDACLKRAPSSTYVLNPIATPNCDYPYWEHGKFNGRLPFSENLMHFCKDILRLDEVTKENGINIPSELVYARAENRIIFHPTSSRLTKNWTKSKYLKLSKKLDELGYESLWILTKEESSEWPKEIHAPSFLNLAEVASCIANSGFMIGNDSGIGHLASCLGLPTLTICRHQMVADFWRPSWSEGKVVCPPRWIPNIKALRFRDKYWQKFISVHDVYHAFFQLQ